MGYRTHYHSLLLPIVPLALQLYLLLLQEHLFFSVPSFGECPPVGFQGLCLGEARLHLRELSFEVYSVLFQVFDLVLHCRDVRFCLLFLVLDLVELVHIQCLVNRYRLPVLVSHPGQE